MNRNRIVHQATAFGLAAVFTLGILSSINMLATEPVADSVMAAEKAASQVAQSAQGSVNKSNGG